MKLREKLHRLIFRKEASLMGTLERQQAKIKQREDMEGISRKAAIKAESESINRKVFNLLKTLSLDGEIPSIGVTKESYCELKSLWKTSPLFIRYPFPMIPIEVGDDGVTVKAEWSDMPIEQRQKLTIMIYGATGKFLNINEDKPK